MTSASHIGLLVLVGLVGACFACDGAAPRPAAARDRTESPQRMAERSVAGTEARAPITGPAPPTAPVGPAAIAPAGAPAKRQSAAALADRLAAAAQQAADFRTRRAAELETSRRREP